MLTIYSLWLALQSLLDAASDAANIIGLSFRPDKCARLSLTSTQQRATFVQIEDFTIQGNNLPALSQEESYRYLGVPIGLIHNIDDIPNIVPQFSMLRLLVHLCWHLGKSWMPSEHLSSPI